MSIVLIGSIALLGATLLTRGQLFLTPAWHDLQFYDVGLVLLIVLSAAAAVVMPSALAVSSTAVVVSKMRRIWP